MSLIFSGSVSSKLLKRKLTTRKRNFYSLKEVCRKMGHKHILLAESVGPDKVDCMSKTVKITNFCLKELKDHIKLTRGYVDKLTGDAVCESADNVEVSLSCDKRDMPICLRKKRGCLDLLKVFAVKHELVHYSLNDNKLNCYFSYVDDGIKSL